MKIVRVGNGRNYEVPETFKEGIKILDYAYAAHAGRGQNAKIQSACARVAYGLFCDRSMMPDPTEALLRLMQKLCKNPTDPIKKVAWINEDDPIPADGRPYFVRSEQ